MLHILDYGILSGNVYEDHDSNLGIYHHVYGSKMNDINTIIKAKKNGWLRLLDVDSTMQNTNHFYAQLYFKFENEQLTDAVVAIRGTVFTDKMNLLVDALTWSSDVLGDGSHTMKFPYFYDRAVSYIIRAKEYIHNHFPLLLGSLRFTGHSLGGAIATLLVLNGGFVVPTVTFNAPGIGHLSGLNLSLSSNIHNINSRYGIINRVGKPINTVIFIDIPQYAHEARQLYDSFNREKYEESVKNYQGGKNIQGFINRMSSFLGNNDAIRTTADYKKIHQPCADETERIKTLFAKLPYNDITADKYRSTFISSYRASCEVTSLVSTYKNILIAQHSIENIINALLSKTNLQLAFTVI